MPDGVPPVAPRRRIATDAYCHRCGYNVRGVEVDDADTCVCPECAERCTAYYLLERPRRAAIGRAQWSLAVIIAALAAFVLAYQSLSVAGLKQTAALFVGLPALLSILITLTPAAKSATGMAVKGVTIALLVSGVLLGEGIVCVLMMAPVFYVVAIVIGVIIDVTVRQARSKVSGIKLRCGIAVPLLLVSLEGATPALSFPRDATVIRTAVIDAPAGDVRAALAATPRLDGRLPLYLRLGFPRPEESRGRGLAVGRERVIRFVTFEGGRGELRLRVAESEPGRVVFAPVSDTSKISGWLHWKRSEVTWAPLDAETTRVTWRLDYERRLDPAWYFAPWQRYAVGLCAEHLIETVATPREE